MTEADVAWIALSVAFVLVYFLPSIVATRRQHPNAMPVFLINFFLGWTLIGWVAALVWSTTAFQKPEKATP